MENVEVVKRFLRAQNLEQLGRIEEAIELYEIAVAEAFDSTGPYDRLIGIYSHRANHSDVMRVAESALANVQTHEEKRGWYREMREHAERASASVPRAAKKAPPSA
jgi:tetratricopeptide (TPR) repeat protein